MAAFTDQNPIDTKNNLIQKILLILSIIILSIIFFFLNETKNDVPTTSPNVALNSNPSLTPSPKATLSPIIQQVPTSKILASEYHIFQSFNNCGPAALSMTLFHYGIEVSQFTLGQELRPYQNPQGDNDDKSVTLEELSDHAKKYNLTPFHRPNGSIELVKQFIANDMPIITRTLLNEGDDIGHYRVIKGYDDTTGELIQDDSLQGHNLRYSYDEFNQLWQTFNYEYLVLVPPEKEAVAINILGEDIDLLTSWKKAAANSRRVLESNPDDIYARFNLAVALYHIGDFQNSITQFELVEDRLPFRTLWYQIEPIEAYLAVNDYQKVLSLTDQIFEDQNRGFSELNVLRGKVFEQQGNFDLAEEEFEKAVYYNQNIHIDM